MVFVFSSKHEGNSDGLGVEEKNNHNAKHRQRVFYLCLDIDSPEAVVELQWAHDFALRKNCSHYRRCRPVPRARGHLKKPLLQRELTHLTSNSTIFSEQGIHVVCNMSMVLPAEYSSSFFFAPLAIFQL